MGRIEGVSYLDPPQESTCFPVGSRSQRPGRKAQPESNRSIRMNNIVWIVGAVVIVLAVLGFFGLR